MTSTATREATPERIRPRRYWGEAEPETSFWFGGTTIAMSATHEPGVSVIIGAGADQIGDFVEIGTSPGQVGVLIEQGASNMYGTAGQVVFVEPPILGSVGIDTAPGGASFVVRVDTRDLEASLGTTAEPQTLAAYTITRPGWSDLGQDTGKLRERAMESTFEALAEEWRRDTGMLSSVSRKAMHSAYQQIIGMGSEVVPFILRDLQKSPDHWFWALQAIARESPVPSEHAGDIRRMTQDWIKWGKIKGHL